MTNAGNRRFIFLLGFMGSGKTTVGQKLAQRLGWRFFDLDGSIEQTLSCTIAQIFAERGVPFFRQVEHETLRAFLAEAEQGLASVVALGGGTFAQPQNFLLIRSTAGVTLWLRCSPDQLLFRCATMTNRPLFRDEASFRQLYDERLPFYQQADYTVDTEGRSPEEVVDGIIRLALFE